jgi:endonuclease/exonuclease/phosphatase family metal-dependent hydrolase
MCALFALLFLLITPPAVPASPNPANGVIGVTTTPNLSWTAAGATSYEVRLGTTSPPPTIVADTTDYWYPPQGLNGGTTYYWQIVAKNAGGTTASPVWSFTTVGSPAASPGPAAAGSPNPPSGAIGVTTTPNLSWKSTGATSYDLRFGTANPPPTALSGTTQWWYATPQLNAGTMYYWQVVAKNSTGATAGPIWWFKTDGTAAAPPTPTPTPPPTVGLPAAASAPNPPDGALGVTTAPNLSWRSSGATSYEVRLGASNPPSTVVSSTTDYWYAPQTLSGGTKYFWQIVAKNSGGTTIGPLWSFTTAGSTASPPPSAVPPPTSVTAFRMMTWNVQSGKDASGTFNLYAQTQLIASQGVDVVCLEEVETWMADEPALFKRYMQDLTGQTWYAVYSPNTSNTGTIGNLLLSRFPISQQSTTIMAANPGNPSDYLGNRGAARALISIGGVPINFFATHFDPYNTSYRTTQLNLFMSWARSFDAPRLVGGDFNSWWGEWWIGQMETEYTDTWLDVTRNEDGGYSRGSVRIDYLFRAIAQQLRITPTRIWVVDTTLSDHRPVVADYKVQ